MYRLVLNTGSHREEQTQAMSIDFFEVISEQEKRRTAREILCFIYLLNRSHILAHLNYNKKSTLESWCEDIKVRGGKL